MSMEEQRVADRDKSSPALQPTYCYRYTLGWAPHGNKEGLKSLDACCEDLEASFESLMRVGAKQFVPFLTHLFRLS